MASSQPSTDPPLTTTLVLLLLIVLTTLGVCTRTGHAYRYVPIFFSFGRNETYRWSLSASPKGESSGELADCSLRRTLSRVPITPDNSGRSWLLSKLDTHLSFNATVTSRPWCCSDSARKPNSAGSRKYSSICSLFALSIMHDENNLEYCCVGRAFAQYTESTDQMPWGVVLTRPEHFVLLPAGLELPCQPVPIVL